MLSYGTGMIAEPDLVVEATMSEFGDTILPQYSLSVVITNIGDEDADGFYLDLFADGDDAASPWTYGDIYISIRELGAGESTTELFVWGGDEVWVTVDKDSLIIEDDEGNNDDYVASSGVNCTPILWTPPACSELWGCIPQLICQ